MDNAFILKLRTATGKHATRPMRLAARLMKLFNARNRHFVLKFRRDDLNRFFGLQYTRLDPNEHLLQGGMITVEQAVNLYHLVSQVLLMNVPGDVVELGCYEGTTAIILQTTLDQFGAARTLHVYDSFEGLPAPSPEDGSTRFQAGDCRTTRTRLVANFERFGVRPPVIHEGWFRDTLPAALPEQIAFAHVDCDFYAPVTDCLRHLYPRLAAGAVVVVDDYCDPAINDVNNILVGVKRACDEFLADKPETMHVLIAGSASHGYFRKV